MLERNKCDGKGLLVSIEESKLYISALSIKQSQMSSLSMLKGCKVLGLPILSRNTDIIVHISINKKLESYSFFSNCLNFSRPTIKKISNLMAFLVAEIWVGETPPILYVATTSYISVSINTFKLFLLLIYLDCV